MKFLCLAYGSEEGWNALTSQEQDEALKQDEELKSKGNFLSAVKPKITTVTNWGGDLVIANESFARSSIPLAGFSIIEANDIDEAISLVANTPCARAQGAIEIRPFWDLGSDSGSNNE